MDNRANNSAGGPGWNVREPQQQTHTGWTPAVPPPLPPPSPYAAWPQWEPPQPIPAPRRSHAGPIAGAAVAVLAIIAVAVVGISTRQSAAPATAPIAASGPGSPSAAAIKQAAADYLAAVAPVNTALNQFSTDLKIAMSLPCKCPAGEFNATVPFSVVPSIVQGYQTAITAFEHIKHEVPQFSSDIDAVIYDNKLRSASFDAAYHAFTINDDTGIQTNLSATDDEEAEALPAINKLRADLGLPPADHSGATGSTTA